jgi:transposase
VELRMSRKERDRLKVMAALAEGRLKQVEAARLMKLSVRHVRRVRERYDAQGDAGLVHRSRGRPSNRRIPAARRERVLERVRADYADFGPTLAAEKLAERDGLAVNRETLRQWMVEDGLWKVRRPAREVHLWRPRRSCAGELVQMDTSEHDWFEGRGEAEPVLITVIDDATSRLLSRFYGGDTTLANLDLIGRYVRRYGRPLNTYADRKSLFKALRPQTDAEALAGQEPESQVARALRELGMPYIPAGSPQAKGRVERSFGTEQDRLVKELRLAGISTIETANRFLDETYLPDRNQRFAVRPASSVDAHRPVAGLDLAAILSVQTWRTVSSDYTVRHKGRRYQIERRSIRGGVRGARVQVEERIDGSMKLRWQGRYLKFHALPDVTPQVPVSSAAAARRRRRGSASSERAGGSTAASPRRPAADHPWREPFPKRTVLLCTKEDISTLR